LYHPGDAVLPSVGGFQKTPIVAASDPNALEILEDPKPVEAPITSFFTSSNCSF
jgi:hypothetical protein